MDEVEQPGVARLRHEYRASLVELWSENADLSARLGQAQVSAVYDVDDDLLEITLDGPQEALSCSIHNTLYLRADFDTYKIVGLELEHFRSHAAENSVEFRFCWSVLQLAGTAHLSVRPSAAELRAGVLDTIVRELVATP